MLKVGLSGGIGSGKSTVARRLKDLGAVIIDADLLAREVVEPGTEGLRLVAQHFGPRILATDGSLDRPALGRIVFGDDDARAELNAILHPRILAETDRRFNSAPADAVVVHDMPLLVELDRSAEYHLTVIVAVGEKVRLARLIRDRGMSEQDAQARIAAQATDAERRAAADVWLPNESAMESLQSEVDRLWAQRLAPFNVNLRARTPAEDADAVPVELAASSGTRLEKRLRGNLVRAGLWPQVDTVRSSRRVLSGGVPGIAIELLVGDADARRSSGFQEAMLWSGFVARASSEGAAPSCSYDSADPGQAATVLLRRA